MIETERIIGNILRHAENCDSEIANELFNLVLETGAGSPVNFVRAQRAVHKFVRECGCKSKAYVPKLGTKKFVPIRTKEKTFETELP